MSKEIEKSLYRIIDANFNRCKEGLRVCEDICRFVLDEKFITRQYKDIRHELSEIVLSLKFALMVKARDIQKDVGKSSIKEEFNRKNISDVFFANSQRVKESIRVLEELLKLKNKKLSQKLKELRYRIYAIEQKIIEKI